MRKGRPADSPELHLPHATHREGYVTPDFKNGLAPDVMQWFTDMTRNTADVVAYRAGLVETIDALAEYLHRLVKTVMGVVAKCTLSSVSMHPF